jgi:hypothetical protein
MALMSAAAAAESLTQLMLITYTVHKIPYLLLLQLFLLQMCLMPATAARP